MKTRLLLITTLTTLCLLSYENSPAQQTDTSSFFPLGMWGIWIDSNNPPFSRDLNSTEWVRERSNWVSIQGNWLMYWIPYWVQDTVVAFADINGYKTDIANWYYWSSNHKVLTYSLYYWMINNSLSDSNLVNAMIDSVKLKYGSHSGFYNYTFQSEHLDDLSTWPKIQLISRKIRERDPEHKSCYVTGAFVPSGFTDMVVDLDCIQVDQYTFQATYGQSYTDQQTAFDDLLYYWNRGMNSVRGKRTEWQAVMQAHHEYRSGCSDLRRPNFYELRTQAYLALSRGARGITSYVYGSSLLNGIQSKPGLLRGGSSDDCLVGLANNGLVDINRNPYTPQTDPDGLAGFANLANLYGELKLIGPTIRKLRGYDGFPNTSIPSNNIANISSVSGNKIEVGVFKRIDQGADSTVYFMVVNRVCNNQDGSVSSPQNITVNFNNSGPSGFKDIASGDIWAIPANGSLVVSLDPGKGRLLAKMDYQAALLGLAQQGKSTSSGATAYSNNHVIEKDGNGRFHFVFQSGGEIFYRRSQDGGASWDITQRISDGTGNHDAPSIAIANDGSIHVVWQQKRNDYDYYICYSRSNIGYSWSAPIHLASPTVSYYQSNLGSGQGAEPVIAAMNGSQTKLLCVWDQNSGLKYIYSPNLTGWVFTPLSLPEGGSTSTVWHPSLATVGPSTSQANLIYDDRFGGIYSNVFNANANPLTAWSSYATVGSGAADRYGSNASNMWGEMYGVWSRWNGSLWYVRFRYGYSGSNSWSSWVQDFSITSPNVLDSFYPVVTYYMDPGYNEYIKMLWSAYRGSNYTIQMQEYDYYYGGNWRSSPYQYSAHGILANMSHEWYSDTYPTHTWTDLVSLSPPYQVIVGTPLQAKATLADGQGIGNAYRAVEIFDRKNGVTMTVKLEGLNFKKYDWKDTLSLSLSNVFDYLKSEDIVADVGGVNNIKVSLSIFQKDTLSGGTVAKDRLNVFKSILVALKVVKDGSTITEIPLLNSNLAKDTSTRYALTPGKCNWGNVILVPKVSLIGSFDQKDLDFVLVNGMETIGPTGPDESIVAPSSIPEGLASSNYPNPFNPTTQIFYSLPHAGHVVLNVYDLLGRQVQTLVDANKPAGRYEVRFDASQLASGMYFYRFELDGKATIHKMLLLK